ncbi:MAG: hypothetical protein A2019_04495 [Sulfurimonas sp. GWF2_37_8]|nr:MAG: hypothetical protein A2019_04495 [Sulfurimonas sp. GWF2_37_8]
MSKAGCDYNQQNTTTIKDIEQNMPLYLQKSIPTSNLILLSRTFTDSKISFKEKILIQILSKILLLDGLVTGFVYLLKA